MRGKGGGSGSGAAGKGGGGAGRAGARPRGQRELKRRLTTARGRTVSSQRWLERQLNDPYVAAARREGYRSRAAYKLLEIDDKYRLLKPGQRVVDLGAAPGGWSQVAAVRVRSSEGEADAERRRGKVVAIDILPMATLAGVTVLHLDFLAEEAPARLRAELEGGRADVVLSDMAAETTGHTKTDHLRIMGLAEAAAEFAMEVLEPGGSFVCKVFQGGTERALLDMLKRAFAAVRHVKPPASRADSAELYVVATGFRGTPA
jgi:23S rRNA (uridine2552-2'-O)-methyltransferase